MDQNLKNILFNVLGGVIVTVLTWWLLLAREKFKCWKKSKIMGQDFTKPNAFYLVYASLVNFPFKNDDGVSKLQAYARTEEVFKGDPNVALTASSVVSECEVRSANYISNFFGASKVGTPALCADKDLNKSLVSFVSFGGPGSNGKTASIDGCSRNYFLTLKSFNAITDVSGTHVLARNTKDDRFGYILRVKPRYDDDNVWIACAGIDERGTSGAAWFLANKWDQLWKVNRNWYNPFGCGKGKDFAAIIKVNKDSDDSATLYNLFSNKQDVEKALNNSLEDFDCYVGKGAPPPPSGYGIS